MASSIHLGPFQGRSADIQAAMYRPGRNALHPTLEPIRSQVEAGWAEIRMPWGELDRPPRPRVESEDGLAACARIFQWRDVQERYVAAALVSQRARETNARLGELQAELDRLTGSYQGSVVAAIKAGEPMPEATPELLRKADDVRGRLNLLRFGRQTSGFHAAYEAPQELLTVSWDAAIQRDPWRLVCGCVYGVALQRALRGATSEEARRVLTFGTALAEAVTEVAVRYGEQERTPTPQSPASSERGRAREQQAEWERREGARQAGFLAGGGVAPALELATVALCSLMQAPIERRDELAALPA